MIDDKTDLEELTIFIVSVSLSNYSLGEKVDDLKLDKQA